MARPITIISGQWSDLGLEEGFRTFAKMGYDGVELATQSGLDVHRAATDTEYAQKIREMLQENNLDLWAISAHLIGQCVGDVWDSRLDNFAPAALAGKPEEIRAWAIEEMKDVARAAKNLGVSVVTGFLGSPIWKYWYSFPQTSDEQVMGGFDEIVALWSPIFDVFDACGVKFALEVHPTEIAFDYYSAKKLLEKFHYRPTLGFNFDPSHLLWQGVNPAIFIRDFADRIYHVHIKDVKMNMDGRNGILGSHLTFGDTRRGWNFVSVGHGDVDFDSIIRELNQIGYCGPLSVEWEDSGMERIAGAAESLAFIRKMNFERSDVAFDSALKNGS